MKTFAMLVGIVLLVIGALIALQLISYPDTRELLRIGDNAIKVQSRTTPPASVGYLVLGVGGVVVAWAALMRKR